MKRPARELPAGVRIGTRLLRICHCEVPRPGAYVVVRVGGGRKMAWAEHDGGGYGVIIRANDMGRNHGERYEMIDAPATKGEPTSDRPRAAPSAAATKEGK